LSVIVEESDMFGSEEMAHYERERMAAEN
jgi:hypothetical protein